MIAYRGTQYEPDEKAFQADAYTVRGYRGIAHRVLGWEVEADEDTEWSGYYNRTGRVVTVMIGDDRPECCDPEDVEPIAREDYCGICGQMGCTHDGYDREED